LIIKGNSSVVISTWESSICVADNYEPGQPMTGCLIFDNKSFSSIGGGPIIDGITSSVFWNAGNPEGTQAIVFQSNRTAVSSICYPSLVTTPMAAPVTNSPLAAPVADSPITPPLRQMATHPLSMF
jgi:hypothetical protein